MEVALQPLPAQMQGSKTSRAISHRGLPPPDGTDAGRPRQSATFDVARCKLEWFLANLESAGTWKYQTESALSLPLTLKTFQRQRSLTKQLMPTGYLSMEWRAIQPLNRHVSGMHQLNVRLQMQKQGAGLVAFFACKTKLGLFPPLVLQANLLLESHLWL